MLFPTILALAATAVAESSLLEKRQFTAPKNTYSDLVNGTCKGNTLIYVRGGTEPGNTGIFGMGLIPVIQAVIPDLAVQGLDYPAGLMSYTKPFGADPKDIATATSTINLAVKKCPSSNILLSGWSLGTAVIRGSLKQLPADVVEKRIAAVLLFGDTQYKQNNQSIPGLPAEKWKIFCNKNDGSCGGQITFNGEHMVYQNDAGAGAQWLAERVKAVKAPKARR